MKKLSQPLKRLIESIQIKQCKICFKDIKNHTFLSLINDSPICNECYNNFNFAIKKEKFLNLDLIYLGKYENYSSKLLIQYKENLDYELKDVFFKNHHLYLELKFFSYYKVLVPSSKSKIVKRGFNHLKEMTSSIKLKSLDLLYKDDGKDQKEKNAIERKKVNTLIHLKNQNLIEGKNILLIDDVMTTGSSLKSCIDLIRPFKPKNIKILILLKDFY